MLKKLLLVVLALCVSVSLVAQPETDADQEADEMVMIANQMMLTFMERMKVREYDAAREVAQEMVLGHEKIGGKPNVEHKSFYSAMEKELYTMQQQKAGNNNKIVWVSQPISDGFYLLSMLDFQQGLHEEALENMQRAIHWNPVRSAFFSERGFMLLNKKGGPDLLMAQIAYERSLELADNTEDFASALRGLAFVSLERGRIEQSLACLLVAETFDTDNMDTEQQIAYISRMNPALFASMDLDKAKQLLRKNGILVTYSPDHVKVLMSMADNFVAARAADKAISLLRHAQKMAPENALVRQKLQRLQK